ncbi:MAG: 4-hydroxy-tetrahydrodipicolinate reductase, partial [Thermoguttaceae bacterium]|nr:4-hydroxy-tetrahydrodipicolinate reductase [Thermoguttaceae bacterium]
MTKIAFFGAAGKMGKRLVALGAADSELEIVAALEAPTCPDLGRDAGEVAGIAKIGVPITAELPADVTPDVIVDFSSQR